jgi:hypothetical protein
MRVGNLAAVAALLFSGCHRSTPTSLLSKPPAGCYSLSLRDNPIILPDTALVLGLSAASRGPDKPFAREVILPRRFHRVFQGSYWHPDANGLDLIVIELGQGYGNRMLFLLRQAGDSLVGTIATVEARDDLILESAPEPVLLVRMRCPY